MPSKHAAWVVVTLAAGSVLVGCPAGLNSSSPLSSVDQTLTNDSVSALNDLSDLLGDPSNTSSFLSSVQEDLSAAGVGFSAQSLAVQDVTGNASGFTWPTPQSSASLDFTLAQQQGSPLTPAWLALNPRSWLSPNKKWKTVTTYYVASGKPLNKAPFGSETIVTSTLDGKVHSDELASLDATASTGASAMPALPGMFDGLLPSSPWIRSATLTWNPYGLAATSTTPDTAVGMRWCVYDLSTAQSGNPWTAHLYSWIRAMQITRTSQSGSPIKVDQYDVATNYTQTTQSGKAIRSPYEYISDTYNEASKTDWHMDRTFDGNQTWSGKGTFTDATGNVHSVSTTWNVATGVRTKTISFTTSAGKKIVITLDYNADHSGKGTITLDGATPPAATLAWTSAYKGTATFAGSKTVKSFHAPQP